MSDEERIRFRVTATGEYEGTPGSEAYEGETDPQRMAAIDASNDWYAMLETLAENDALTMTVEPVPAPSSVREGGDGDGWAEKMIAETLIDRYGIPAQDDDGRALSLSFRAALLAADFAALRNFVQGVADGNYELRDAARELLRGLVSTPEEAPDAAV